MKSRSETKGTRRIERAAVCLFDLFRMDGFPVIGVPVVTGTVLVALGSDVVVSLGAIVGGVVAGYLAQVVFIIIGMSFSAEESGYGRAMGLSDNDHPSRGYVVVGWLLVLVPPIVAFGATLLSARLLIGVSREIIGLALAVLCLLVVLGAWINAVRRSAEESARHVRWLRDRAATAAGDPEFLEQLQLEEWRADGPYDEMRAAYFRAWETVKEARRRAGRPIWAGGTERLEQPPDDI